MDKDQTLELILQKLNDMQGQINVLVNNQNSAQSTSQSSNKKEEVKQQESKTDQQSQQKLLYEDEDISQFYNQDWKEIIENLEPTTIAGEGGYSQKNGNRHNFIFIKKYNRIVYLNQSKSTCYSVTFDGTNFKEEFSCADVANNSIEKLDDDNYLTNSEKQITIVANFISIQKKFAPYTKNLVECKAVLSDCFIALYEDLIRVWNWKNFTCVAEKIVADKPKFTSLCAVNEQWFVAGDAGGNISLWALDLAQPTKKKVQLVSEEKISNFEIYQIKRVGANDEFMVLEGEYSGKGRIQFFKILDAGKISKTQVIQQLEESCRWVVNFAYIGGEYIAVCYDTLQFYSKKTGQKVKEFKPSGNKFFNILPYTEGFIVNDSKNGLVVWK